MTEEFLRKQAQSTLKYFKEPIKDSSLSADQGYTLTTYPDIDPINNPSHYQSYNPNLKIECIDAMRAAFGDEEVAIFCKLNAFKYNWRASSKGGNTDIGKAIWYLNKFLELGGCNNE